MGALEPNAAPNLYRSDAIIVPHLPNGARFDPQPFGDFCFGQQRAQLVNHISTITSNPGFDGRRPNYFSEYWITP
jgi:hypothetical protein